MMSKHNIDHEAIRGFVGVGLSNAEIAEKMGWTVGTLQVYCSHHKISLRRELRVRVRRRMMTSLALPREIFEKMRRQAVLMHTTAVDLAASLLRVVVRDNLYNAVLDEEDRARIPQTPSDRKKAVHDNSHHAAHEVKDAGGPS